jgi:hypothetical protein
VLVEESRASAAKAALCIELYDTAKDAAEIVADEGYGLQSVRENKISGILPATNSGAPYLARFSRDVGFRKP